MCFRRDEAWKSLFNYLNGRALLDRREVRQGRSRMHVDVVHDFNKDRNRLVKTMHVRKATVHVQKEQVRNVHTLARSARGKALLPARCALHSQTCSSLAKLLPGNLWRRMHAMHPSDDRHREEKGQQEQTKGRHEKKNESIDYPWPGRKA
jgi:Holliday junction resolvase